MNGSNAADCGYIDSNHGSNAAIGGLNAAIGGLNAVEHGLIIS